MSTAAINSRNRLVMKILKATRALGWPIGTALELDIDQKKQTITISRAKPEKPNAQSTSKATNESPAADQPASSNTESAGSSIKS